MTSLFQNIIFTFPQQCALTTRLLTRYLYLNIFFYKCRKVNAKWCIHHIAFHFASAVSNCISACNCLANIENQSFTYAQQGNSSLNRIVEFSNCQTNDWYIRRICFNAHVHTGIRTHVFYIQPIRVPHAGKSLSFPKHVKNARLPIRIHEKKV